MLRDLWELFARTGMFKGTLETLYMVFFSTLFAYLIGVPLGVLVVVTDKEGIKPNRILNLLLGTIINLFRSIPFLILLVLLIPFTRLVVGTSIGSTAILVPLTFASTVFVARLVETALKEVDRGVIEQALVSGATPAQIVFKV